MPAPSCTRPLTAAVQIGSISERRAGWADFLYHTAQVGATGLGLSASVYSMGHGAIIDSGTSLSYYPRQAYQKMRTVFASETKNMNLGRAVRAPESPLRFR